MGRLGSVVVVLGLSCSEPCGILVLQPGTEQMFPELEGRFLTTGTPGKTPCQTTSSCYLNDPKKKKNQLQPENFIYSDPFRVIQWSFPEAEVTLNPL